MIDSKVVVYTSRDCVHCESVITKLSEWNIDFEERNISDNREYFKELQKQKVYGTPATFVDGEKVLGFQERKLKRILGIPYEAKQFN
ncbi:glutaredoxin family protein [Halobacillus salinus]|uniref:Glutaredoxin family protein n=1 Tax=Halobacillus salinus TaxID=192814 RepID=A0A4Z0GWU2_9BACI|nr:glutaredoxin family protein [Halobacillus salinus]TGB01843.1 glutaredoxin family protein [Halobacillus salinus]